MSQPPQDASTKPPLPPTDGPSNSRPTVAGFEIRTVLDEDTNRQVVLLVIGTFNIKSPPEGARTLGVSLIEAAYHARTLNEGNSIVQDVDMFLRNPDGGS